MQATYPSGYWEYRHVENMRKRSAEKRRRDTWWEDQQIKDEYIRSLGLDPLEHGHGFTVDDELQEYRRDVQALREAFRQRAEEEHNRCLGYVFDWQYGAWSQGYFGTHGWIQPPQNRRQKAISAYNNLARRVAVGFYLFKFLVCWFLGLRTSESYPDVVELACFNTGTTYYEGEPYGDTAEVGYGVFKNWFWCIGSL